MQKIGRFLLIFLSACQAHNITFNIAGFVQESASSQLILPSNIYQGHVSGFSDPAFITDLTGIGIDLWQHEINKLGGSRIVNCPLEPCTSSEELLDNILYNVTWFNVASPTVNSTYLTSRANILMHEIVDLQKYGVFQAFVVFWGDTPSSVVVSSKCEITQSCIVVYPLQSDPELYVCNGEALQPECLAKGRSAGERRFDFTFSLMTDPAANMEDFIQLMRFYQAKSISMIAEDSTFGVTSMAGSVTIANNLGMNVLFQYSLPAQGIATLDDALTLITALLQAGDPDVFILFARPGTEQTICFNLVLAMHQLNWMPKAFANAGPCTVGAEALLQATGTGASTLYSYYTPPWDASLRGLNYHVVSTSSSVEPFPSIGQDDSPQTFAKLALARYQGEADNLLTLAALGATCTLLIQKGIEASGTSTPTANDIRQGIQRINEPSVIGQLEVDTTGRLVPGSESTAQIIGANSAYILVTPLSVGNAPTYPAPSWNERSQNLGKLDDNAPEQVVTVFCSIAIVYTLCQAIFIIIYRHNPIIRAATPEFCLLCLLGTLLLLIVPFTWSLHNTTESCVARVWFLQLGFSIILSALFIKTFRICRIFSATKMKVVRITTPELLVSFSIIISLEIIFTIIWTTVAGSIEVIVVPDVLRPSEDYTTCSGSSTFNLFTYIAVAVKCIMILLAVILGWKTRKAPSEFNESTYLGIMSYNLFVLLSIALAIIASNLGDIQFNFYFRSLILVIIATSTSALLIIPKVFFVYSGRVYSYGHTNSNRAIILSAQQDPDATGQNYLVKNSKQSLTLTGAPKEATVIDLSSHAIELEDLRKRLKEKEDELRKTQEELKMVRAKNISLIVSNNMPGVISD